MILFFDEMVRVYVYKIYVIALSNIRNLSCKTMNLFIAILKQFSRTKQSCYVLMFLS